MWVHVELVFFLRFRKFKSKQILFCVRTASFTGIMVLIKGEWKYQILVIVLGLKKKSQLILIQLEHLVALLQA